MQYPDRDVRHQGRDFFRFDDFPVALLINGESASSSEIVAAALVDHERGVVIGDRSFGKGSTQDILELKSSEGAIRLTTALARRPNGKLLHRGSKEETEDSWGVTPDPAHRVPMLREDAQRLLKNFRAREIISALPQTAPSEFEKDPQLQKAIEWLTSRRKSANTAGR
jgi:C-terminal processing protease CtpA/Prc